eukprot:gb/GFBE01072301.1/.p1 GENE.gb/GFBE01072301.1/~~gb/GFBE01072301.1/.p1  ORF type:complete len:345 (+),score=62.63 gb/GFBE01072301.1/:1-1035(+)
MPSRRRSRSRRSRSRRRDRGRDRDRDRAIDCEGESENDKDTETLYSVQLLPGRRTDPWPSFDLQVDEGGERVIPHVCARPGEAYVIRVTNSSRRHIACAVTVDGENALLKDGSLIVAPRDSRELQGYLVSKNFIGKEYVKEYRDFVFGKPKVIESEGRSAGSDEGIPYTLYGRIVCEVYEAVLDEEVDSDQELKGQTTHYRGAGQGGSNEERKVPEGKKKHFMYSAVTVQGSRSTIANSTRGRWWVRGTRKIRTLEIRYREPHTLMLLGVDAKSLGLNTSEDNSGVKYEKKEEDDDEEKAKLGLDPLDDKIHTCDLTADDDDAAAAIWTVEQAPAKAEPVNVVA